MVSDKKENTTKGCKIAAQFNYYFFVANLGLNNHLSLCQASQDFEVPFRRLFAPTWGIFCIRVIKFGQPLASFKGKPYHRRPEICGLIHYQS